MTDRQLSLKRRVYDFKKECMGTLIRDFRISLLGTLMQMVLYNLSSFKEELYNGIMYLVKEASSDIEFEMYCITFITSIVQYTKNIDRFLIELPYTFLTKEVLPEMWRSRKEIELKRQRKLENLANLLDNDGRYQEAHVIRIIVKPHLERMNRKWANMTTLEKFKSLLS